MGKTIDGGDVQAFYFSRLLRFQSWLFVKKKHFDT